MTRSATQKGVRASSDVLVAEPMGAHETSWDVRPVTDRVLIVELSLKAKPTRVLEDSEEYKVGRPLSL